MLRKYLTPTALVSALLGTAAPVTASPSLELCEPDDPVCDPFSSQYDPSVLCEVVECLDESFEDFESNDGFLFVIAGPGNLNRRTRQRQQQIRDGGTGGGGTTGGDTDRDPPFDPSQLPSGVQNDLEEIRGEQRPWNVPGITNPDMDKIGTAEEHQAIVTTVPLETIVGAEKPSELVDKPVMNGSLIDEDHPGTFGEVGLILVVDPAAIMAASPGNISMPPLTATTPEQAAEQLVDVHDDTGLPPPDKILEKTDPSDYNEIAMVGAGVEVGGFYVQGFDGKPLDQDAYDKLKEYADKHDLEIVILPIAVGGDDF